MFIAVVLVERQFGRFAKAQERGCRAGHAISVEAVDIHAAFEGLPGNLSLLACDVEEVADFESRESGGRVGYRFGFHSAARG